MVASVSSGGREFTEIFSVKEIFFISEFYSIVCWETPMFVSISTISTPDLREMKMAPYQPILVTISTGMMTYQ